MIPSVGGGSRSQRGRGPEGGQRPPRGLAPYIIVDDEEDDAPQEGSVPPGPQEGERAPDDESDMPPQPMASEGPTEPRPAVGAEVEGSAEAPRAETTVEAPVPTAGETGNHPTTLGAPGGAHGAPSSQKGAAPRARYVLVFDLSFNFLFFSFFEFALSPFQPEAQGGFSGARAPKGREEGGSVNPWVSEAQVAAPLSHEEGELSHEEGGRRRGRRRQIPRQRRRGRRGPKSWRGQSWPSGLFPFGGCWPRGSGSTWTGQGGPGRGGAERGASREVSREGAGPTRGPRKGGRREHGLGPESRGLAQP